MESCSLWSLCLTSSSCERNVAHSLCTDKQRRGEFDKVTMKFVFILSLIGLSLCCNHNGRHYNNGDIWIEKNAFKMRCIVHAAGWKTEIISCLTPDGHEISVNSSKTQNNYFWECKDAQNGFVTLKQISPARPQTLNNNCGGRPYGYLWIDRSLQYRCDAGGVTSFVGCVLPNGEILPDRGFKKVNDRMIECRRDSNGIVIKDSPLPLTRTSNCVDSNGTARITGSHWIVKRFQFRCDEGGITSFVGCVLENGEILPDRGSIKMDDKTIECRKGSDGTFTMDILQVSSTKTANCVDINGTARVTGSIWNEEAFQYRCEAGGVTRFVGCVLQNGEIIPHGEFKKINDKKIECTHHANGAISINVSELPFASKSNCIDSNQTIRKQGEQWTENKFVVHECRNGVSFVVGCKVPGLSQIVPLGGKVTDNGRDVLCEKVDGSYKFYNKEQDYKNLIVHNK